MATIERFEDLVCWQAARKLRGAVYRLTRLRPFSADFALVNQIRRAALSASANIAEGFEREGNREFARFLAQAKGSVGEVKDELYAALDENYISQADFEQAYGLADETTRLLGGFIGYLRRTANAASKFKRPNA
ncbi:MAG: four helix bundle protein [Opitutia bacterium Tous-C1TDCM]|nr:MAG: four helix bundle protein [Opitutae bacterium Tous-C1TDCM]